MNKLFLVSFVAIVAACPAFADVTINANASTAQCDNTTLGTYTGPANLNSVWIPAISGAISLDANRYAANDSGSAASTATTAVSPATVYSLYGTGVYSTQPTTSNWASYTASNRLSALTTSPQMTGYTFDGFYTTKASDGTQLIDSSGNFKYNTASSQISTDNDTATWYARWTPINYTITYACGDGTGNAPTTNTSATYDAQFTPATNTCTPPTGYSFTGWLVSGTQTTVNSAFTWEYTENKTLTAQYTANNITLSWNPDGGTAQDGTTYAPGTGTNQCTYGGDITMPAIPKKNGYHLLGWDLIQNPSK